MNKSVKIIAVLLLSVMLAASLIACNNTEKEYTVTWKNDNGDILKKDEKVKEGTIPVYDGETPKKQGDDRYSYIFEGWTPEIRAVSGDVTYTATYTSSATKYTVTWKNYNGEVLESDTDVPYGTMPEYNGEIPNKDKTAEESYVFAGWEPAVSEVIENAIYTAKFEVRKTSELVAGIDPIVSDDYKTVKYGFYPQTRVKDENLLAALNALDTSISNGWYLYEGEYYAKETAKVYNNENYSFDDGTAIINGNEYWFKCEIITWQILSAANGQYYLVSAKLLDAHNFYSDYLNRTVDDKTVYANNYEKSGIREWLNGEFYQTAFTLNNAYIQAVNVDNGAATTNFANNQYACGNTADRVYLLSYKDYLNSDYGFEKNAARTVTRECRTTDYARARGAWCNETKDLKNNGSYWTRSPSDEFYYCAWNVNSAGVLSNYAVDGNSHSVRPCITIAFN